MTTSLASSARLRICAARHRFSPLRLTVLLTTLVIGLARPHHVAAEAPAAVRSFLTSHCYDCHEGEASEAAFDLTALDTDLQDSSQVEKWVRLFDRVHDGEMPPADAGDVDPTEVRGFLAATESWLRDRQRQEQEELGRVRARRLTNLQLERTLQDLLGIDIPLARRLPDAPRTNGFSTVAVGQAMSHFQLERQVAVIDAALDEAFRRATSPADEWERTLDAQALSRRRPRSRVREPELIDEQAVTWASDLVFYGRLPATTAAEDGWYRFTVRASALKSPADHGVWCTVRSGRCVSSAPLLGWIGSLEAAASPRNGPSRPGCPRGTCSRSGLGTTLSRRHGLPEDRWGRAKGTLRMCPALLSTGSGCNAFTRAVTTTRSTGSSSTIWS